MTTLAPVSKRTVDSAALIASRRRDQLSLRVVDLGALELVAVVDVDGFPGSEEVEGAQALPAAKIDRHHLPRLLAVFC